MGTPIRNTVWMVCTIPATTPACTAGGRRWSDVGSAPLSEVSSPGGIDLRCKACTTLVARRLAKMAPNTAVPNDPPIMRKNVAPEVAVPNCS